MCLDFLPCCIESFVRRMHASPWRFLTPWSWSFNARPFNKPSSDLQGGTVVVNVVAVSCILTALHFQSLKNSVLIEIIAKKQDIWSWTCIIWCLKCSGVSIQPLGYLGGHQLKCPSSLVCEPHRCRASRSHCNRLDIPSIWWRHCRWVSLKNSVWKRTIRCTNFFDKDPDKRSISILV